jgi:hypothetical protein
MATAANTTRSIGLDEPTHLGRRIVALVPGLLLLAAVGYAGKFIEQSIAAYTKSHHIVFPNIEYVLWAIVLGLLIANTVGVPRSFNPALPPTSSGSKPESCFSAPVFCSATSSTSAAFRCCWSPSHSHSRSPSCTSLAAASNSNPSSLRCSPSARPICGVSAIIAAKPAIDADDEDASYAIAAILALGALSLFTFPLIGHSLHLSDKAYGLWAGLAVDNTAEATAAGALYSDAAGKVAVLAKTSRNALIGFVVLAYAIYWASRGEAHAIGNKAQFLWQKFPKFVLGFLLISLLATLSFFTKPQLTSLANLSRWAFLLTFAGVGLRTASFTAPTVFSIYRNKRFA